MDGRGRALDNVFVERLWRVGEIRRGVSEGLRVGAPRRASSWRGIFAFYNHERPHQSLAYRTPAMVYATAKVA